MPVRTRRILGVVLYEQVGLAVLNNVWKNMNTVIDRQVSADMFVVGRTNLEIPVDQILWAEVRHSIEEETFLGVQGYGQA